MEGEKKKLTNGTVTASSMFSAINKRVSAGSNKTYDFLFFPFSLISNVNLIFYVAKKCVPEIFVQGVCFFKGNVFGFLLVIEVS